MRNGFLILALGALTLAGCERTTFTGEAGVEPSYSGFGMAANNNALIQSAAYQGAIISSV